MKLKKEKKLILVEKSKKISDAYKFKSINYLKSAKVLYKEKLYENSIIDSYYSMYSITLSLFFFCGIKCENHTVASLLLNRLYSMKDLSGLLTNARKERINRQYYISDKELDQNVANNLLDIAEDFLLQIDNFILNLDSGKITAFRNSFDDF